MAGVLRWKAFGRVAMNSRIFKSHATDASNKQFSGAIASTLDNLDCTREHPIIRKQAPSHHFGRPLDSGKRNFGNDVIRSNHHVSHREYRIRSHRDVDPVTMMSRCSSPTYFTINQNASQ